jgi:PAS domain S-box-containing protein
VNRPAELDEILGPSWSKVLQHLDDAVMIMDHKRILRFVNPRARRLLGYEVDETVGGRCRLTTRGVDCENACPLTFALEGALDRVENFSTVYHDRDGKPVPLDVTVIPFHDQDGEFRGAVEILRPTSPDPGFFLSGRSERSEKLRAGLDQLARSGGHAVLVGSPTVCADVAQAIHRFSGVAESLFFRWTGSWKGIPEWPPGTVLAYGEGSSGLFEQRPPDGWRLLAGVADADDLSETEAIPYDVFELPTAGDLEDDLPMVVAAWLERLRPRLRLSPGVVERLSRVTRDLGFEGAQIVLDRTLASAGDTVDENDIPVDGYHTAFLDELLRQVDPLAALEERLLREVLSRSGWRMQEAADRLGISRVTLWRKLKDYCIERPNNSCSE